MKKILTILMSLIVLVGGAHPVLVTHFCEGELYSFDMLGGDDQEQCCQEMQSAPQPEESKCAHENKEMQHPVESGQSSTVYADEECCEIQKIQISTDDYRNQEQQFNLKSILPSFENVWMALYLSAPIDNGSTTKNRLYSPPEGLGLLNVDILTYICTYRI